MSKYVMTDEMKVYDDVILRRVKAVEDYPQFDVKAGDLGGWVEKEENLRDDAWVADEAVVCGRAVVRDHALVCGHAEVVGNAEVNGNAVVGGYAEVSDYAKVIGNADVRGNTVVHGKAVVKGNAKIRTNGVINKTTDYLTIGPLGCRNDYTTFYKTKDGIDVRCGCFSGSINKFRANVKETHGDGKFAEEYSEATDFAEKKLERRGD